MTNNFKKMCDDLTAKIQASYEEGITLEAAEKLAGEFLHAQIKVADALREADLDARMKRTGTKAIKAAVYLAEATKGEKKPSDVLLAAVVDTSKEVIEQQDLYDRAEVERDALQNYFNIFKEAHIHFRAIAKGRFE